MAQIGPMECCQRENVGRWRGALPKEDGDQLREHKATNEDNFFSSWPMQDVVGTEEGRKTIDEEVKEEECKSGNREVEREEEKTVIKRRCVNPLSSEHVEELSPMEETEGLVILVVTLVVFRCVCLRCLRVCLL